MIPSLESPSSTRATSPSPVLRVQDLRTYFPIRRGFFRRVVGQLKAVDGVSFGVNEGETFALVGESGSGKSTAARSIIRAVEPTGGKVLLTSPGDGETIDVTAADRRRLRDVRRQVRFVFQDPFQSLNPRMTVLDIVGEPLVNYGVARSGRQLRERVSELLGQVGLDPTRHLGRYPHAFSGGQRQRIGLARALALEPRLILADEPTSALDVSVQAQILNLMQDLRQQRKLSYVLITHDLHVVRHLGDRAGVMYAGKLVETGATQALFASPRHPYTAALLAAAPVSHPRLRGQRGSQGSASSLLMLRGEVPDPANRPSGCPFHPRCPFAQERCRLEQPQLLSSPRDPSHAAACHFSDELDLQEHLRRSHE